MDNVNHPSHYTQGGIECIEAIKASLGMDGFCDYCKGNVIKYLWRWRDKGGVEDIQKAQVYLGWMLDSAKAMGWEEEQPSSSIARLDDGGVYCACGNCGLAFTLGEIPPIEFDIENRKAWIDAECPRCGKITDYQLDEFSFGAVEKRRAKNGDG